MTSERIKSKIKTLRGTHWRISRQHHQTNSNGLCTCLVTCFLGSNGSLEKWNAVLPFFLVSGQLKNWFTWTCFYPPNPRLLKATNWNFCDISKAIQEFNFFMVDVLSQINPDLSFHFPTKLKITQPKWSLFFSSVSQFIFSTMFLLQPSCSIANFNILSLGLRRWWNLVCIFFFLFTKWSWVLMAL